MQGLQVGARRSPWRRRFVSYGAGAVAGTAKAAQSIAKFTRIKQGRVSFKYIGENATVVMNEQGKVITGWANNGTGTAEEHVDNRFSFLSTTHADLLNEILARRSPTLLERIRESNSVSRSDAEEIISVINEEFTENLDDDWEPTDYGRAVSAVLAKFNAARINEWP